MTDSLSPQAPQKLARLMAREAIDGEAVSFCLPGGTPLFQAGEAAEQLYLLTAGRLAVRLGGSGAPGRIALIHPGEPVGEMALISGVAHAADVFAVRDSELVALPREAFFKLVASEPDLLLELSRIDLLRTRAVLSVGVADPPRVFGFVGVSPGLSVRPLVEQLGEAIRQLGHSVAVIGDETGPDTPPWLSNIEAANDYVLYSAEFEETNWKVVVERQVDSIRRVGDGGEAPPEELAARASLSMAPGDLILVQSGDCRVPKGSAAWTQALSPSRLFHVRRSRQSDIDRLARVITGRAVGLVLSGGAARAYAHIGAIRALHAANVPIDMLGGVSMGAIIGAGLALEWDDEELDRRIRQAFVKSSPVDDITLPLIAMSRGDKVRARLAEHFGDRQICDLWLPFFCGTTNLTSGTYQVDRRGMLREVLRASLSVPGVLPPVTVGEDVLVDGAVLNNFPADVMRGLHDGPIVGVDVGRGRSIEAKEVELPRSLISWFATGEWRNGPPIVSLLMRAATVTAARDTAAQRQACDVLVLPDVDAVEIRNWKAYEPAVDEGRRAMEAALAALNRPVTELRRAPHPAVV